MSRVLPHVVPPTVAALAALMSAAAVGSTTTAAAEATRAIATVAGALCIGLCVLLHWDRPRHVVTTDPAFRPWSALALWAGLWTAAAVALFVLTASELAHVTPATLTVSQIVSLLHSSTLGQWGLVAVVCPLVLTIIAVDAARGGAGWHPAVVGSVAVFGVLAPPLSGHLSLTTIGSVFIAAHVAAAALWLGPLLAALATLRTTTTWAAFLPRYSRLAWWCAVCVTGSGVAALTLRLISSPTSLEYCILAAIKAMLIIGLLAGGYHLRQVWVGARCSVATSLRRAATETAFMATAVGVAATLSYTP